MTARACLVLLLMGLICQERLSQGHWAGAVCKRQQASVFFIGRFMQGRHRFRLGQLLAVFAQRLAQITEENWG